MSSLSQSLPHMDAISFCCTSWKWVPVVRGEWKHTFWDWAGSSWQELTKPTQGQSSWLCWYGSETGQHTPEPNSPWQHYGSHNGSPSVIYLHVFKFIARAHALDIHFELQRWCKTDVVNLISSDLNSTWLEYCIICYMLQVTSGGTIDLLKKVIHLKTAQRARLKHISWACPLCSFILFIYWHTQTSVGKRDAGTEV